MSKLKTLKCEKCDGEMRKKAEAAHSQGLCLVLILLGIPLLFFFPIGTIFGVVLFLTGLVMGSARRYLWICSQCGYKFERKGGFLE